MIFFLIINERGACLQKKLEKIPKKFTHTFLEVLFSKTDLISSKLLSGAFE